MHNIKKLYDYSQPLVAMATILVLGGFIIAGYTGGVAYRIKTAQDTVVVTGSAKRTVEADTARWTVRLETKTGLSDQSAGFTRLVAASEKIAGILKSDGFEEYETGSNESYPEYRYENNQPPIQIGYTVSRTVTVRSSDLEALQKLANAPDRLFGEGYVVSGGAVEFSVSSLPELRVSLLSEAIKDAHARATAIAKDSSRGIGTLKSASSGVVQVLPQGGIEISDYGSYDTTSRTKDVMVTVRAEFSLR